MTEENQKEPKTLEELAGYFGRIDGIYRYLDSYNDLVKSGADPNQRARFMQGLARSVVGPDTEHVDYQNELRQYVHPEAANVRASEAVSTTAGRIKKDYEARIDEIVEAIVAKLNKSLEGAKEKHEALEKIAYAFYPALRSKGALRTLNKDEANKAAASRLMRRSGALTTFVEPTSEPGYEQSLQYRLLANEFLNEKEDKGDKGEKTYTYAINEGRLKELIKENVLIGSILYTAEEPKAEQSEDKSQNERTYREAA